MANVIDRVVGYFNPAAGVQRVASRAALARTTALTTAMSGMVENGGRVFGPGGYRGAQSDRRQTKGWRAKLRSANADTLGNRGTLVARSRDAAMNMPLGGAVIERQVTFAVGTGMLAIPQIDADRLGIPQEAAALMTAQVMRDYDNYMSSKDPDAERVATGYELQEVVLRGQLESGDILGIRTMPKDQRGRKTLTAWKLVEGDRVVSPHNHKEGTRLRGISTNPVIVGGVEQDEYGAAVAYHVLKRAPESGFAGRKPNDTVRLEAWGEKTGMPSAILVMQKLRAEQARGVPLLAPVLEILRQLSELTDSELFAAVLTSMLAITYKSPGATALPEPEYGQGDIVQSEGPPPETLGAGSRTEYRMEPGGILEIDTDAEVDLKAPGRPNPAFEPFFVALAKQLGARLGTPVEVVLLAFNSSYTASKAALENFYVLIRKLQASLGCHWCTPGYEAWLFEQVAKGRYDMPGFLDNEEIRSLWSDVRHRGDGKITLNPAQEAKALEIYEAHGWRTGQDITAELSGGDYDANIRTRIGEHKRLVAGGLPVPNAKGGGNAPASEHRKDDGDEDGE